MGSRLKNRHVRDRYAYLLREESGAAKVIHDRHFMSLFPRTVWLELISAAGFEPLVVPFEHSSYSDNGQEVFLRLRPASFEADYPIMGRIPDVLAAIERSGLSLIGHFTLPDEAWWNDFYTPMETRIEELRGKYRADDEALAVLDQLGQEPEMHQKYSDCYAYEFFVARRAE